MLLNCRIPLGVMVLFVLAQLLVAQVGFTRCIALFGVYAYFLAICSVCYPSQCQRGCVSGDVQLLVQHVMTADMLLYMCEVPLIKLVVLTPRRSIDLQI